MRSHALRASARRREGGVLVAARGRGEREVAPDGPGEDARRRDDVAPVEGHQQLFEERRALGVAEGLRELGEHADGHRPHVVARDRREVALGQAVVLAPRLRRAPGVQVQRGQRDAPGRHGRQLIGELAHRVLELAHAPLPEAQPEELRAGEDGDRRVLQAPAQLDALVDELLGVLQAPGDHRPPRAVQRDVGAGARVARVGGDARQRLDRHVGAGDVVELEQQVDLPRARADGEVGVAGRVGQREELVRPGQAALGGVGPVGGDVALVEDVGQRRRVVELAGDAERRLHELLAALRGVGVVQRDGQAHEQPRAQRAAVGAQPLQRLLEHGHEVVVDHARREPEAARG